VLSGKAVKIRNKLFCLRAPYRCYACHVQQDVIALGAAEVFDEQRGWRVTEATPQMIYLLHHLQQLPPMILDLVARTGVNYSKQTSSLHADSCFANWCFQCGVEIPDSLLSDDTGGPFVTATMEAATHIELAEIVLETEVDIDGGYSPKTARAICSHWKSFSVL
jgi:hypothetical protein